MKVRDEIRICLNCKDCLNRPMEVGEYERRKQRNHHVYA